MSHPHSEPRTTNPKLRQRFHDRYAGRDWQPFPFQEEMMQVYLAGKMGCSISHDGRYGS